MTLEECRQHFSKNIRNIREALGMSQRKFATMCGVTWVAVDEWETKGSLPALDKIFKLGELFNVDAIFMLTKDLEFEVKITTKEKTNGGC